MEPSHPIIIRRRSWSPRKREGPSWEDRDLSEGFESPDVLWAEQPRLVHNLWYFTLLVAYCGFCHQSAVYYMIVESRPYVKLFRLITLIPTLLLILQCLLPPKEASFAMLVWWRGDRC